MKKIGILGGGQLARMMILKAHELGMGQHTYVLSENKDDPAAQVTSLWCKGSLNNTKNLKAFFNKVDIVTFESEFIDCQKISQAQLNIKVTCSPNLKIMSQLQDRLWQKNSLIKDKIPTAPYCSVNNYEELVDAYHKINQGRGLVLKARLFGYDGYGTYFIRSQKELEAFTPHLGSKHGFIAESLVDFKRELSLIAVRNQKGQIEFLPLSESHQVDGRCFSVCGPIDKSVTTLKNKVKNYLAKTKYVGVIAFELFDTGTGLLVNETAPRVHNTGHYSQNALITDQFAFHLLALQNKDLPKTKLVQPGYAMINLLGRSEATPKLALSNQVHLHWYGKNLNRKNRKMGHINSLGPSPQIALQKAKKALKEFRL